MTRTAWIAALLMTPACSRDSPAPAETIIETGYLRCASGADGCDLSCIDEAGGMACLSAPTDACAGEGRCECEGAWVCGERACDARGDGFECLEVTRAEQATDPRCRQEEEQGGLPFCSAKLDDVVCRALECPDQHPAYYRCDAMEWVFIEREGSPCAE